METLKKLTITEGMKVDYVKKHGNNAQKIAASLFDVDNSGDLKGREVELFNSCVFKIENDKFTVYDNELRKDGHGGKIVFKLDDVEYITPKTTSDKYKKLIKNFDKDVKYGKDSGGYRHLGLTGEFYTELPYSKKLNSFDEIQTDYAGMFVKKMINVKEPFLKELEKKIDKLQKKITIQTQADAQREDWFENRQDNPEYSGW